MKNLIYNIVVVTVIVLTAVSCESFLAEEPRDVLAPENFFNSDAEAKSAVNGLYRTFYNESLYNNHGLQRFYVNGADVIGPNREYGAVEPIQNYTINEGNMSTGEGGGLRGTWQDLYRIIQDANLILSNTQDNENMSSAGRDQTIGETLFIRSLAYYHLSNLWGNVPYYRENLPLSEVQTLGRTDRSQIRDDLLQDLQQAQDLLPDSYPESELGRASRWAAATLMVKIHLWQENWEQARDKAVEIIDNSPHSLLDDYADVFDPENPYNDEIIFQIDFAKDIMSQRATDHWTPRIRDEPLNSSEREAFSEALSARDEGFTGYGLAIPLPDLVNNFPADDLRRPMTVLQNYLGYDLNFPYTPKKWNLDQIDSPRGNHGDNYIVFRLSDVYLMAAEAENELNGPGGAYQYINRVRERAYEPDQPLSGLNQQQFREAIYDERKWELTGEGHRRIDLIRWGILLDVVQNTEYRIYNPAANIQPHHVLLPIPVEELELNPALLESDPTNNGYR